MRLAYIDGQRGLSANLLRQALRDAGTPQRALSTAIKHPPTSARRILAALGGSPSAVRLDITVVCTSLSILGIERIYASALPIVPGLSKKALTLAKGWPVQSAAPGASVTDDGIAILTTLATPGPCPSMTFERVGCCGPHPLLYVGSSADPETTDIVWLVETNLDNATGELIGFLFERLFEAGALDVFTTPIQMKKSRPGVILSALVAPEQRDAIEEILLTESPTFGVRRSCVERRKLARREVLVRTPYGRIRVKVGHLADTIVRRVPEYEDVRAAALKHHVPFSIVWRAAEQAAQRGQQHVR